MTKVGFTGTRRGMTDAQKEGVLNLLTAGGELHHGDCVGADEEADEIARVRWMRRIVHPPVDKAHRAFVDQPDELREPKTHFARNRDIVDETDRMIATPWQDVRPPPKTGGGTWQTICYAEKRGKPVYIVWPDGRVEPGED